MKCPDCGYDKKDNGYDFCLGCGKKLPPPQEANGGAISIGERNDIAGDVNSVSGNQDNSKNFGTINHTTNHVTSTSTINNYNVDESKKLVQCARMPP